MKLIDADILPRHGNRGGLVRWQDIEDAPTIDAEPVTRCADCGAGLEYNGELLCIRDYHKGFPRKPEDFCSRAIPARKEENK